MLFDSCRSLTLAAAALPDVPGRQAERSSKARCSQRAFFSSRPDRRTALETGFPSNSAHTIKAIKM
jgi:hypothetical protein